jgi:hypothetical protein
MIIELSRQERLSICDAINRELKRMAADYAASCDRKMPNMVLFHEHGLLTRLRDKVLTGKSYAEQDAEDGAVAEASERAGLRLMGAGPVGVVDLA